MDILVLGGTSFVGRAIVDDLLTRGHTPTLFTRGVTNPDLFPETARLIGDRNSGDYSALQGHSWDAVVDVSGYVPRHVAQAMDAAGPVGRYLFISTGSVYAFDETALDQTTEQTPRLAPWRESEEITGETYGALKVACEDDVVSRLGEAATIVRPGIVAGPHDPTDRFTYWVRRATRGGTVALPGRSDQPVQVVDSRDLARLVTLLLEGNTAGIYNAVGPAEPVTMTELIAACAQAAGTTVDVVPVDPEKAMGQVPLILGDPAAYPLFQRSAAAAHAVGMPKTPLAQTAADVLAWDRDRGLPKMSAGWSAEQEAAALTS